MTPIRNKTSYSLHEWFAATAQADAPAGAVVAEVVEEDFRGEPHLYCYWLDASGELADGILGPYCDELGTKACHECGGDAEEHRVGCGGEGGGVFGRVMEPRPLADPLAAPLPETVETLVDDHEARKGQPGAIVDSDD